ncbi:hypothetical protein PHLCEN_2v12209 [Hermanssonia centrifuga]|uniref:Uncharacterized protein n=1 Tax=Hermanssonia centrifuga TaxID=98765 RepID=A0A2R6NI12_9APHY|nr:hypothetical protein PHLCEN_2v12209 [Hermanssonia centrifuga]
MSETTTINVVNIPNVQTQGTGEVGSKPAKGWRFWLVILAMAVSAFTSALDLVSDPCLASLTKWLTV